MKPIIFTFIFLVSFFILKSQTLLERELGVIANELIGKVNAQMSNRNHNLAIKDFVYQGGKSSKLGAYLAQKLGNALVNSKKGYTIASRELLQELDKEIREGSEGGISNATKQTFGKIKGITAIVEGNITPVGNYIDVSISVSLLAELLMDISVEGKITRTPTIINFEKEETSLPAIKDITQSVLSSSTETTIAKPSIVSYTNNNIRIDLKTCVHQGSFLDCEFHVTSDRSDNFAIRGSDTRILDLDQRPYIAQSLSMNAKSSSMQVNQSLQPNVPVAAVVRFANVPITTNAFYLLELNCTSYTAYSFVARFNNLIIQ